MIWVIANKVEEDGSFPTYKFYKQAFADDEIDIYCAGQNDDFSFIRENDIAFIRTRDENIVKCVYKAQKSIGFKSTLESEFTNMITHDKDAIKKYLDICGLKYPRTIHVDEILDGVKYFVKPKCGENSIGVDKRSLCNSFQQVMDKCKELTKQGIEPIIEEYIDGYDITTSIINIDAKGILRIDTIKNVTNCEVGFQTFDDKYSFINSEAYKSQVESYANDLVEEAAKKIFEIVKAKHYIRVDFRIVNEIPYVIDVNMIPGLAPNGYMSKCLYSNGVNYKEFIKMVVHSAS